MIRSAKIRVHGIVQGVGFRPFVYRIARENRLKGIVLNRGDALVEITVTGEEGDIEGFLTTLKRDPPPASIIEGVDEEYLEKLVEFNGFHILKSSPVRSARGSTIPADISICEDCLRELLDPSDRRYGYFFITCTNCGPRFTVIDGLPYDRKNTSMGKFRLCSQCNREFMDPMDRRFHAQTIACEKCGPKVFLLGSEGARIKGINPILEAGRLLEEGFIVAVKGNGGFHLAASTTDSSPIKRLRRVKYRSQKPFAIMARSLDVVRGFAHVSAQEESILASPAHPIVLLKKTSQYYLSDLISPGLDTIGVMLPYTGLHVMLFNETSEPAFIMTSANPPSEPIVKDNDEAFSRLRGVADYFLVHDRDIRHRCDDSVLKVVSKSTSFIRRSRGYTPHPLWLKRWSDEVVLGVGAEQNVTACLLMDDKAFLSQHIGDTETEASLCFIREAITSMEHLTNCRFEKIACDLHPGFNTTRLAEELSSKTDAQLMRVQHHHAHSAKLMAETGVDELITIVCDGFGYGIDGKAWGGEVLRCQDGRFKRVGHLEEHPLLGGDLAAKYPLRMLAGILGDVDEFQEWLFSMEDEFPHGLREVEVVLRMAEKRRGVQTSSCGRILDAASALLGICVERTYEGEPAMKLESAARGGISVLTMNPLLKSDTLLTKPFFIDLFQSREKHGVRDLAYSIEEYLAHGLAEMAVEKAEEASVKKIGFTGGVAYNDHMTTTIKKTVEERGCELLLNKNVPCGDGGLSLGQAYLAAQPLEHR